MNATVSILTEIRKNCDESLKSYLETHPDWDQDRVFAAALSLFVPKMEMVIAARFGLKPCSTTALR